MPLSARTRIEAYLPDLPRPEYQDLLSALELEFTYTFGGCSTIRGVEGHYLSHAGARIRDRVNIVYCDTPFAMESQFELLSQYSDELREAIIAALDEESVLIAAWQIYHSE
ncbi:MAG: hypothetical protein ACJ8C4_07905 [Gemmataceae bacterium]